MDAAPLVIAFTDSPSLRETLAVLLEQDCQLRFASAADMDVLRRVSPDLALVSEPSLPRLLHDLAREWPALPVVALQASATAPSRHPKLRVVPLEPDAIRAAVLQGLPPVPDAALRRDVSTVAAALRAELEYPAAAMRQFANLAAATTEPESLALARTMLHEQSSVFGEVFEHLQRFRSRPRAIESSATFPVALGHELERAARQIKPVGLLLEPANPALPQVRGPLTLVPLVTHLILAYLRRHVAARVVRLEGAPQLVRLRYAARPTARAAAGRWYLLLAALAMEPFAWSVDVRTEPHEECIDLRAGLGTARVEMS